MWKFVGDPLLVSLQELALNADSEVKNLRETLANVDKQLEDLMKQKQKIQVDMEDALKQQLEVQKRIQTFETTIHLRWQEVGERYQLLNGSSLSMDTPICLTILLPPEILLHIFEYLSLKDVCKGTMLVGRRWKLVSSMNALWERLYIRAFGEFHYSKRSSKYNNNATYQKRVKSPSKSNSFSPTGSPVYNLSPMSDSNEPSLTTGSPTSSTLINLNPSPSPPSFSSNGITDDVLTNAQHSTEMTFGNEGLEPAFWGFRDTHTDDEDLDSEPLVRGGGDLLTSHKRSIGDEQWEGDVKDYMSIDEYVDTTICYKTDDDNMNEGGSRGKKSKLDWYSMFVQTHRIERNWKMGRYKLTVLEGHQDWVTCLAFDNKVLVSGSWDSTVKIWDLSTGKCKNVLNGHTAGVTCLKLRGRIIVSGSTDGDLRVWDLITGKCLTTLRGHSDGLSCLEFVGLGGTNTEDPTQDCADLVLTGSLDSTLKLWDLSTSQCLKTLIGHPRGVTFLAVCGRKAVSGSLGGLVFVWDWVVGTIIHRLEGHSERITTVAIDTEKVVSASWDHCIRVWDLASGRCLHVLSGHVFRVRCFYLKGNTLVSGGWDSNIHVWDLQKGVCVKSYSDHTSNIWAVQFYRNRLVSACWAGKIIVRDTETDRGYSLISPDLPNRDSHPGPIMCMQFKGPLLLTASKDIRVWNFDV